MIEKDNEPPISIIHLLGWITCTAAFIAMSQIDRLVSVKINLWFYVGELPKAMACGAALEGLAIMLSRRWRGKQFPRQPGEWILVTLATYRLVGQACYFALRRIAPQIGVFWDLIVISMFGGLPFLDALLFAKVQFHWRILFAVLAISIFAFAVPGVIWLIPKNAFNDVGTSWVTWLSNVRPISWIAIGAFAVAIDRKQRICHSWLHWVGVAVLFVLSSVDLLNRFAPASWFD
jgi:hypothetical protein